MGRTQEVLKESDRSTDSSTLASLASDAWDKTQRVGNVISVTTKGLVYGIGDGASQAMDDKTGTGVKIASSLGLGALMALTSEVKAVRLGATLVFGGTFAYDTLRHGEGIAKTMRDTYNYGDTKANVDAMKQNLGQFAFDTTLMVGGTMLGAGMAKGGKIAFDKFGTKESLTDGTLPMHARVSELLPGEGTLGRQFSADLKAAEIKTGSLEHAREILKTRKSYSFGDKADMDAFTRDSIIKKDETATQLKGNLQELAGKVEGTKADLDAATKELGKLKAEQQKISGLTTEQNAVTAAQRSITALEGQKAELPAMNEKAGALREELKGLTKGDGKTDGKVEGKVEGHEEGAKKAKEGDAPKRPAEEVRAELDTLKGEIRRINGELDESNAESAINRARKSLTAAQENLAAAEQTKGVRVSEIQGQIDAKNARITELKAADGTLGSQLHGAIKALDARIGEVKADEAKIIARTTPLEEPKKVAKPAARTEGNGDGSGAKDTAGDRGRTAVAERPATVERAKPVEQVQKTPLELANEKSDAALKSAKAAVAEFKAADAPFQAAQEKLTTAKREIEAINSGRKKFEDDAAKQAALTKAKEELAEAEAVRKPKYFKPMAQIHTYAKTVEAALASSKDYGTSARDGVKNLHDMLDSLRNSRQPAGQRRTLMDANQYAKAGVSPEQQLTEIMDHMKTRLDSMNDRHSVRVKEVSKQGIVNDAFTKADKGDFPANGSMLFFQDGKIVQYHNSSSGRTENAYFDVQHPTGTRRPDRLIGKNPEGYVVVAPRLGSNGEPITVKRPGGKATVVKEVIAVGGKVPEGIVAKTDEAGSRGTGLGDILNRDRRVMTAKAGDRTVRNAMNDGKTGTFTQKPAGDATVETKTDGKE